MRSANPPERGHDVGRVEQSFRHNPTRRIASLAAKSTWKLSLRPATLQFFCSSKPTPSLPYLRNSKSSAQSTGIQVLGGLFLPKTHVRRLTWAESSALPQRLSQKMPPKQATLGYVKSGQQTLGCMLRPPVSSSHSLNSASPVVNSLEIPMELPLNLSSQSWRSRTGRGLRTPRKVFPKRKKMYRMGL